MAVVADVAGGAERCTAGGLARGIVSSPSRPDYNPDLVWSSAGPSPLIFRIDIPRFQNSLIDPPHCLFIYLCLFLFRSYLCTYSVLF